MRVFVSYRRSDVGGYAGRLVDSLVDRLGERNVFQDVTTVSPGQDFTLAIDRALDDCDTLLAVIGPGWLSATTPEGVSRLTQPDDYVRMELTRALERGVPVIPLLVGGARFPGPGDLPAELRGLIRRQAIRLHDESWHDDVEDMVRVLQGERASRRPSRRRVVVAAVVLGLALMLTTAVLLRPDGEGTNSDSGGRQNASADGFPGCVEPGGGGWHNISLDAVPTGSGRFQDAKHTFRIVSAKWRAVAPDRWQVTLTTRMEHDDPGRDRPHGSWLYDFLTVARMPFALNCISPEPTFVRPGLVGRAVVGFDVTCDPLGRMTLTVLEGAATIDLTADKEPSSC